MKKLGRKQVIRPIPLPTKASAIQRLTRFQITKTSTMLWLMMELRHRKVEPLKRWGYLHHWYLISDVMRMMLTYAMMISVEEMGHDSPFMKFSVRQEEWKPRIRMKYNTRQRMYLNPNYCSDALIQMRDLGYLAPEYQGRARHAPLAVKNGIEVYRETFQRVELLVETYPYDKGVVPPHYIWEIGVTEGEYYKCCLYVRQIQYIRERWDEIYEQVDFDYLWEVSDHFQRILPYRAES